MKTIILAIAPLLAFGQYEQFNMAIEFSTPHGIIETTGMVQVIKTHRTFDFHISDTTLHFKKVYFTVYERGRQVYNAIEATTGDRYEITYLEDKQAGRFSWAILNQEKRMPSVVLRFR